ncbi:MAG: immunoglobulin domain-containing protein [Rhodoferax sp.]|nr:immunoglobulin domain-containing protein [Rhodoferax sp.]
MKSQSTHIVTAIAAGFLAIILAACGGAGGYTGGVASNSYEKPAITTPPTHQSVVIGNTATFTVVATGSATLAYQWKKNGTDISGATSSTYTTPATSSADNGATFSVSASNSAGTVTSSSATLAVTAAPAAPAAPVAPVISTQPVHQSVVAGQSATFTVLASDSATTSYQWKKNGTNISAATSNTYTTPATSNADNDAVFTVVLGNSAGTVTSSEAKLTVTAAAVAPSITGQPFAKTVTAGQTATFSVQATGTSPLRYQWKKGTTTIPNATSSSYTTPATSLADSGTAYSVVVRNELSTAASEAVILTVTMAPVIAEQPTAKTADPGATATFSVTATGTAPFSYQWRKNGTNILNATGRSYTTPATSSADNNAAFTVVVTNSLGSATSSAAILFVNVPAGIDTQPVAQSVFVGETATFSVTATGTEPLAYQWKKNGTDIKGATSSTYTTPATTNAYIGAVAYSVVVSNSAGTVTSNSATLSIFARYSLVPKASGGTYALTECVKDNTTGLIWEGKTASPAATSRLGTSIYTNYDASYTGGTDITVITNSMGYVNSVNAGSGLCGFTDWRLPTSDELEEILASSGNPMVDTAWLPNTQANNYWSSSPHQDYASFAWHVNFDSGIVHYRPRSYYYHVRLVR